MDEAEKRERERGVRDERMEGGRNKGGNMRFDCLKEIPYIPWLCPFR